MKVLIFSWRDSHHPEGGGSERYVEHVAEYLAAHGHHVTIRTARYPGAPATSMRAGVQYSRAGGRFTVYPRALVALVLRRLRADIIIDVHNGIPFFATCVTRTPVILLTHHCHEQQWPVAGRVLGRIGWWLESRISPRIHRRHQWVTVSQPSADELAALGIPGDNITIIRNGCDPAPAVPGVAEPARRLVCVSRLVPHKQLEHAIDVIADLHATRPGEVVLDIAGSGWWENRLRAHAAARGVEHAVNFHGHVSEEDKHALLASASVLLIPSVKEGWGITVMEAAAHGVPAVGYVAAGGLRDSITTGVTGLLVDDYPELLGATVRLLDDEELRRRLGEAARALAATLTWESTGVKWLELLRHQATPQAK